MSDANESEATQETSASTAETSSAVPDDIAAPLVTMIATIRAAVARGASDEARAAGATACRSILTVLGAKPGEPLGSAPPSATASTPSIAALLSQPGFLSKLASMSREQLLDLLRQATGSVSPAASAPGAAGPRFHLIQIPQARRPGGS
jgi:hypothetical protein